MNIGHIPRLSLADAEGEMHPLNSIAIAMPRYRQLVGTGLLGEHAKLQLGIWDTIADWWRGYRLS